MVVEGAIETQTKFGIIGRWNSRMGGTGIFEAKTVLYVHCFRKDKRHREIFGFFLGTVFLDHYNVCSVLHFL
jgi:hypothetical protein